MADRHRTEGWCSEASPRSAPTASLMAATPCSAFSSSVAGVPSRAERALRSTCAAQRPRPVALCSAVRGWLGECLTRRLGLAQIASLGW